MPKRLRRICKNCCFKLKGNICLKDGNKKKDTDSCDQIEFAKPIPLNKEFQAQFIGILNRINAFEKKIDSLASEVNLIKKELSIRA